MLNGLILGVVAATAALLIWPRLANAPTWRATITPLASIIGSGFLVLGPILNASFGGFAPLAMVGLCLMAYLFGAAIRFNIAAIEAQKGSTLPYARLIPFLETTSAVVLAFAYFVSVAYYLNLFGAFGVSLTAANDPYHANLLTTAVLLLILFTGWTRGFAALERMEQISVGLKLAIIAGLIVGLAVYFAQSAQAGALHSDPPQVTGWQAITLMAGLIVTVQGFETSRYIGASYDAPTRMRAMRLAQWISTGIYGLYIVLLSYAFDTAAVPLSETAIIDLMQVVAPILPLLLIVAALSAQFSAAIADTSGSGGLIAELSHGRISEKLAYVLLTALGVLLTWQANIFEIISYASRAFAAYYALQSGIAALYALRVDQRGKAAGYAGLAVLGGGITLFGAPVE